MAERGKPGHVGGVEWVSAGGEMLKGGLGVDRLPEDDDVDHDAEAVELVFLPGLVVLAELAALPVKDVAGQRVAAFAPAVHVMDRAAICRVVDVFEHVQGLYYPAEFGQGAGKAGRGRAALQGAQDRRGTTVPARSEAVSWQISSQCPAMSRVLMWLRASPSSGP